MVERPGSGEARAGLGLSPAGSKCGPVGDPMTGAAVRHPSRGDASMRRRACCHLLRHCGWPPGWALVGLAMDYPAGGTPACDRWWIRRKPVAMPELAVLGMVAARRMRRMRRPIRANVRWQLAGWPSSAWSSVAARRPSAATFRAADCHIGHGARSPRAVRAPV